MPVGIKDRQAIIYMHVFLIFTLAVTAILSAGILFHFKDDLGLGIVSAVLLAIFHTAAGVFCVKVFAGMESHQNPLDAGMSLFGALFLLPLFYWAGAKLTHRDTALVFDDFGMCVIIALMCVRSNCIVSGCCIGRPIAGIGFLWPTREIEIVFWALLLVLCLSQKRRAYIKGIIYPQILMLYGIFRFCIEFLRDEDAVLGIFHFGHIWAVVAFIVGSTCYFFMQERSKRPSH